MNKQTFQDIKNSFHSESEEDDDDDDDEVDDEEDKDDEDEAFSSTTGSIGVFCMFFKCSLSSSLQIKIDIKYMNVKKYIMRFIFIF